MIPGNTGINVYDIDVGGDGAVAAECRWDCADVRSVSNNIIDYRIIWKCITTVITYFNVLSRGRSCTYIECIFAYEYITAAIIV